MSQNFFEVSANIVSLGMRIDIVSNRDETSDLHPIQQLTASFKLGAPRPQSKDAGPHGLSVFGTLVGPASHVAPLILAEASSSSTRLASQTPPCQGEPGLHCSSGPLEKPSVDGIGSGLQKESGLDKVLPT